ncbi:hypothetical protein F2Q70_00011490 [Brassica cretica]|uniref:Uncharacterized protein n=1 Tax=Brassica cretica TaxID=69181 RepID=A0A8S9M3H8_BRACR|nr:hypothetical protein F2Q70_00011490 [Brassica cretica]
MTHTESTASCNVMRILTHEEFAAKHPHPPNPDNVRIARHAATPIDRHTDDDIDRQLTSSIDRRAPITYRVQMPKIDVARLNALSPKPKPSDNPPETVTIPSNDGEDSMDVDRVPMGRTLRKRKEKVEKHLKRGANDKENEKTREKEGDIKTMFCQAREKMRKRVTLKKKSDHGQFPKPSTVKGIEFPHALCDTGASVSILPRVMAEHLGLQVEPSNELFTFVDCSQRNSGGIVRDLEVQIGNALVPVDFHVLDIKLNWNSSLLLGRAFLSRGYARDLEGYTTRVHNKDIRRLLERASRDEPSYICLPEHANLFTQTKLVPEIYNKDEINEMFYGVCGVHEKNK